MNLLHQVQRKFHDALAQLVADPGQYVALIKPAQDSRFGDYQANCAMPLAKVLNRKPREIAQEIVDRLDRGDMLERVEIAGPGFINLALRSDWLARQVQIAARDQRLGVSDVGAVRTVVLDFSSPNVAKPMHVGHLRSTIIGDSLARLFRFLGNKVITDNHLGDWGTQIGILLYGYKHFRDEAALRADPVREMARLYILMRSRMKTDEDETGEGQADPITLAAREETAKLHAGDPENVRLWQMFMPWCRAEIDGIYERLGVHFDHTLGESFYHPMLADVVRSLEEKGIAQRSKGALVIPFGPDEPPALVQKTDGAYTYTTTDLATIRYRMEQWQPDVMLYVVDARQALHFQHLFEAARRWGYTQVELAHLSFGSVLDANRKPIKTREGGAVELEQLLDEAVKRANDVYERSRKEGQERGEEFPELEAAERRQLAEIVGLGAVKYADLSQNRTTDYVFNWEKMLAMDGNTATYMQYAYARIRNIFRKGDDDPALFQRDPPLPLLDGAQERTLALQLLRFEEALLSAATEYKPNTITAYLWDLAKCYSGFYQNCPVLRAETPALRQSRLLLCDLTARTIRQGLDLLGIQTVERM
ncbi:MAG TPA: arginine--tRNA ligase [Gemmataceae bacterium]|nr:arginine--tRNA ligase [Gemmataceae bacterium]